MIFGFTTPFVLEDLRGASGIRHAALHSAMFRSQEPVTKYWEKEVVANGREPSHVLLPLFSSLTAPSTVKLG
jgi:hypothetical protein